MAAVAKETVKPATPPQEPGPLVDANKGDAGSRVAAKKAAAKPAGHPLPRKEEPVPSETMVAKKEEGSPAAAQRENLARATSSQVLTPSDCPDPSRDADDLEPPTPSAPDGSEHEEATQGRRRRDKTEAEKAMHARYMRFSRSLKRSLECMVTPVQVREYLMHV